jgi:hypothetical protein
MLNVRFFLKAIMAIRIKLNAKELLMEQVCILFLKEAEYPIIPGFVVQIMKFVQFTKCSIKNIRNNKFAEGFTPSVFYFKKFFIHGDIHHIEYCKILKEEARRWQMNRI